MKPIRILPLLLISVSALTGCSDNNEDNENVVQFWHTFGQNASNALNKVCGDFQRIMKEHGVDVTIKPLSQGGYDELDTKITDGFAAGNTPTMAVSYQDSVADYLYPANGKYVVNLNDYFTDPNIGFGTQDYLGELSGTDDIVEAFFNEGQSFTKEGTYTLPLMKSTEALFYNKNYITDAYNAVYRATPGAIQATDAEVETWIRNVSWEDFISFCVAFQPKMTTICDSFEYVLYYDSDANFLITKMIQEGIPYSSIENGKGKILFEEDSAKTQLKTYVEGLKQLSDSKVLTTKGVQNTYGSDFFKNMNCLFTVGSTGGTGYNDPGTGFHPGVTKVPASKNNPKYVSQGPSVTFLRNGKYSDEKNKRLVDLAFQFYKYISSPEVNTYLCVYGSEGYFPISYNAYDTTTFQRVLQQSGLNASTYKTIVNEIAGNYLSTPVFPGSATLRDEMEGIMKNSLTGTKTVEQAINDAIDHTKMKIK